MKNVVVTSKRFDAYFSLIAALSIFAVVVATHPNHLMAAAWVMLGFSSTLRFSTLMDEWRAEQKAKAQEPRADTPSL